MRTVNPAIFRAYDIRGLVDIDFDPEWMELFGQACAAFYLKRGFKRAVVGHDCRLSSPAYAAAVAKGLAACGVDVIEVGMVSTPMLYFACKTLGTDAGVMVTASHNPPQYNGLKVVAGASTIHSEDIQELLANILGGSFPVGQGLRSTHDLFGDYVTDLAAGIKLARKIKVVVDGGNGAAGPSCSALLKAIGAEVIELYVEPDGRFPNHHPDPVVEKNVADLCALVRQTGADFGVGLDGDGDRLGVVDEQGRLMYGDQVLAIFARGLLANKPGATVIGEVKCSHLLYRDIEAHGGVAIMGKTGHSLIKALMREKKAAMAGEMSGHMFFADRYYGFDDAAYAAARFAEIVAGTDTAVSQMLSDWPHTVNTPEIRMECPESVKFEAVERLSKLFAEGYDVNLVDGVRVTFADGWGLVRASNTQAVLVLRFEADNPARLAEIRSLIEVPLAAIVGELSAKS